MLPRFPLDRVAIWRTLPDALCAAGALLVGTALWLVHPTVGLAGAGLFFVALGVFLHRRMPK